MGVAATLRLGCSARVSGKAGGRETVRTMQTRTRRLRPSNVTSRIARQVAFLQRWSYFQFGCSGNVTISSVLTALRRDVALRLLQCEARMSEVLADIVSAYGRALDPDSLAKTRRYLEALSSSVRPDDLPAYGSAYLQQLHNPDPRYSGC
jgi:hypothetical protein